MRPALSSPMTMKRIHREVADIGKEDLGPITLAPTQDDLFRWKATIPGPHGSPYEGGVFNVNIQLPHDYPFSAPKATFSTRIYHMNISDKGGICIDILKQNWSPALSLFKVILSLSSLLTDPNPHDPLVPSIATEYTRNRAQHDRTARRWTELYAHPPSPELSKRTKGKEKESTTRTASSSRLSEPTLITGLREVASAPASTPRQSGKKRRREPDVIDVDIEEEERIHSRRRVSSEYPSSSSSRVHAGEVILLDDCYFSIRMASDLKRRREDEADKDKAGLRSESTKKHKLPTGEELRTLKNAADLYQSSSFKLQIDALLPNVRPKESRRTSLDQFLLTLRSHLLSLPPIQPQNPLIAARALSESGTIVPFALPHPTSETKWTVAFEPPSDVHVVGSWANKISVKRKDNRFFGVDLSIEMPSLLFQEKDYLDSRYFHKRSYYLAIVAHSMSTSFQVDVFYRAVHNDPRRTVLVLRPRKGTSHDFSNSHAEVCIIPVLPSSHPIPIHRLSPSHSNIRIQSASDCTSTLNPPSPIYNTTMLFSTFPKLSLLSINSLMQSSPAFGDAYTLLRVWANQRGYGEGTLCIHGFEGKGSWWASVLGFLLDGEEHISILGKKMKNSGGRFVGKGLSSYQLFRASLDFMTKQEFENAPAFVKSYSGHRFSPEEYLSGHAAVFVDATSTINHLVDVPLSSLDMLRCDAQQTLEQLNGSSGRDDAFGCVFLEDHTRLLKRCDAVIRVDLLHVSKYRPTFELVEYGSSDNATLAAISRIIKRGLGNRARALAIFRPPSNVRIISDVSGPSKISVIHIGLMYSSEDAFRLVDHGPVVEEQNDEPAKEFRQLWGDKAELRRFKDGRIMESVVWEVKTSDERAHIPVFIVRHLLHLHFGISAAGIQTIATPFDTKLRLPDRLASLQEHKGVTGGFKAALAAFDGIVKNIKSLDEKLPLVLSNVSPVSEFLRYTSTFSPLPIPLSSSFALPIPLRHIPHIDVILEFEKSSKWPDELRAIQKIKLAFFETMASALMATNPGLRATVHLEQSCDSDIQDHASLEIFTAEGWLFSARLWHDREGVLLERLASPVKTPVSPAQPSEDQCMARRALDIYARRFVHSPRHHRAIAALSHRYTAYPGTVRLVKRWLASHWLLGVHVSEEAVELICARPFVGANAALPDTAVSIPRSKERGFALVIEFLKGWRPGHPLFVPLYEDNTSQTEPSIIAVSSREGVWTISTSEDPDGKMWTSNGPDIIAARRVCALAKETCKMLQESDVDPYTVKRLFSHATDDYDVIIELDPAVLPRYHQNINVDESVWSSGRASRVGDGDIGSRPGFDPARMLCDDLQSTYSDTLKFFFDIYGGHRIGAIWLPNVFGVRPFRALGGFSSTPATEEEKTKERGKGDTVSLNRPSVLDEIERLGIGLIKKITVQEK